MLWTPSNTWGLIIQSVADGTRPSATTGAAVTPAQNAYGSYATLLSGAQVTDDVYEWEVCINSVGISATARDCVVSIGFDPSGGTSFSGFVDLVCGPASSHNLLAGGTWYCFPVFVKAGTSIGAAASVNSSNLANISVFIRCKCQPSHPEALKVGSYIDSFGVALATSNGTAVTEGGASEGTWVQLGSALTRPCWYWEFGYGTNNATMSAQVGYVDIGIGDAVNKRIAIANAPFFTSGSEQLSKADAGTYAKAAIGDIVYGRSQSSGGNTGASITAYGVGG